MTTKTLCTMVWGGYWKNHGENDHMTTLTYEEPCDYK